MTFAIITPALIIGAFPERVLRFSFVLWFSALWLVIGLSCRWRIWVWGGGWLRHRRDVSISPAASWSTPRPACRR